MSDKLIDELTLKQSYLESLRVDYETTWQRVIDYVIPRKPPVVGMRTPGKTEGDECHDNSPTQYARKLAANINGLLTNQSSKWFRLKMADDDLNSLPDVKEYLSKLEQVLRDAFDSSNFYQEIHEHYTDLVTIGTAITFIDESMEPDREFYFKTLHIGESYIDEDYEGFVDTVMRKVEMKPHHLYKKFGDLVSDRTKKLYEDQKYDEDIELIHIVYPRENRDVTKTDSLNKRYASIWYEPAAKHIIKEEGYDEFPYLVVRWSKESGECYGRSPAIDNLKDIAMISQMEYDNLIAAEKIADPPILIPNEILHTDFDAGGVTPYDPALTDKPSPLFLGQNLPVSIEMKNQKLKAIMDGFYVSQLTLPDFRNMTAEEVRTRHVENMRILGPTYGRLQSELMKPLINRALSILFEAVDIDGNPITPPVPEDIAGQPFKIEYLSPLAKTQRSYEVESIFITANTAMQYAQVEPSVLDNIDWDIVIKKIAEFQDVPVSIMRKDKDIKQIRVARQEQQEKMAVLQQTQLAVDVKNKNADAESKISS